MQAYFRQSLRSGQLFYNLKNIFTISCMQRKRCFLQQPSSAGSSTSYFSIDAWVVRCIDVRRTAQSILQRWELALLAFYHLTSRFKYATLIPPHQTWRYANLLKLFNEGVAHNICVAVVCYIMCRSSAMRHGVLHPQQCLFYQGKAAPVSSVSFRPAFD